MYIDVYIYMYIYICMYIDVYIYRCIYIYMSEGSKKQRIKKKETLVAKKTDLL